MIPNIIAAALIACGLYAVVRGKVPFVKNYNGVKNIHAHSRIEGAVALLTGILIFFKPILQIGNVPLLLLILGFAALALILEILLKII